MKEDTSVKILLNIFGDKSKVLEAVNKNEEGFKADVINKIERLDNDKYAQAFGHKNMDSAVNHLNEWSKEKVVDAPFVRSLFNAETEIPTLMMGLGFTDFGQMKERCDAALTKEI